MIKFRKKIKATCEYVVKADKYELTFGNRQLARECRRVLKHSKARIESVIIKRTYEDDFIRSEEQIS